MAHEISNSEDYLDVRDIIERFEELETEIESEHEDSELNTVLDLKADLETLQSLLDDLKGYGGDHQWKGDWYPVTLIRDSYFVEAMQQLCEDIGDFPNGVPGYYVIDWKATADNLRVDYSSVEFDGVTYWYR